MGGTPTDTWTVVELGEYCREHLKRMAEDYWRVGKALALAREKLKAEKRWTRWQAEYMPGTSDESIRKWIAVAGLPLADVKGRKVTEIYTRLGLTGSGGTNRPRKQPTGEVSPALPVAQAVPAVAGGEAPAVVPFRPSAVPTTAAPQLIEAAPDPDYLKTVSDIAEAPGVAEAVHRLLALIGERIKRTPPTGHEYTHRVVELILGDPVLSAPDWAEQRA